MEVRRRRLDVLFNPGFTCPVVRFCPNVTVFHDLQHKRHPEYFRWFDLPFWNLLLWASARVSARLLADSNATRQDLRHFYGVDSRVIPLGVEPQFFDIAHRREPKDYLLCVSTLHPHKNLDRLVCAHSAGMPELVIAGLRGFAAKRLEQIAGNNVRFTGWIPGRSFTSCSVVPGHPYIHPCLKDSDCPCSKPWLPECRWHAPIYRPYAKSQKAARCSSIQRTSRPSHGRFL